jgi:hypothetical protein
MYFPDLLIVIQLSTGWAIEPSMAALAYGRHTGDSAN